jgi:hypothetical protein
MYKVITNVGCKRGLKAKKILDLKDVSFTYIIQQDLKTDDWERYAEKARKTDNKDFPIILNCEGESVSLESLEDL